MKKIRENKNLIIIFTFIFLLFPIQNYIENRFLLMFLALFTNTFLIMLSAYFVIDFSAKFLKHAQNYNYEFSKKDLISLSSLNNNFRFYIKMFITLLFFGLSVSATFSSIGRIQDMTEQLELWKKYSFYKYFNFDYVSAAFFLIVLLLNFLLIGAVCYIFACLFLYSILKVVLTSNEDFVKTIYKRSTKLNSILKSILVDMSEQESISLEKTWEEKSILIANVQSKELRTLKKGTTPPDSLI
ncbi:hypothetical protein [Spiroplasma sp. BIUS-1]|uniref:hypothetical protein n=1 Tax=Spiroplasma sp. BIUS-1 TaxID=216964 RepID=UPI0013997486|nr:hypothetical protein [Spiroplasma sp. BIUS-1]QHX37017.1 hypothetical protein SBIUS_v1c07640 [Spiroplasma sp. BIUS-1]